VRVDDFFTHHASRLVTMPDLPVPIPRVPLTFRVGTMGDIPFMDAMQKANSRALGRFPFKQYEEYVELGAVLIAEENQEESPQRHGAHGGALDVSGAPPCPPCVRGEPLGFIISRDRYLKRDELGVIFQLCVVPGHRRGFVGAALVQEAFARSAYGCRLYCLWCAQDLEANYFWESLGFVPLAFRSGSDRKKRVHIFWQKKINPAVSAGWWYPFQTTGGALRADRIVFPIPPGTSWKDVRAVEIPGEKLPVASRQLPDKRAGRSGTGLATDNRQLATPKPLPISRGTGLRFGPAPKVDQPTKRRKSGGSGKGALPVKVKVDKKFLDAARELRDRYLEHVNGGDGEALLPSGKYAVTKALAAPAKKVKRLAA
jgi:hypothetical protein